MKPFNSQKRDSEITVGDQIISEMPNQVIKISRNTAYLERWGYFIIVFGIIISAGLFKAGSGEFNWFSVIVVAGPVILFGLLGLSYLLKARKNKSWIIDLQEKVIVLNLEQQILFTEISHLFISKVPNANFEGASYQLNIQLKNKAYLCLFTSDFKTEIEEANQYLQKKLKKKTEAKVRYG